MTTKLEQLELMLERATVSASPYVAVMKTTVEDSPWHREDNVWVHTSMVTREFLKIWTDLNSLDGNGLNIAPNDRAMFCAGVAALFHDFGKPEAEEEHTTPERGTYRRYKGHEAVSGAVFREVANSPTQWAELFGDVENDLTPDEKMAITLMIQHHLPYQYKQPMISQVISSVASLLDDDSTPFVSLLRADSRGRISDDHATKLKNVEDWIEAAEDHYYEVYTPLSTNELLVKAGEKGLAYVLVGPSGAGKGTYVEKVLSVGREHVYSMDDLRLKHYGDESIADPAARYSKAWAAAVADETNFKQLCTKEMNDLVKSDAKVVVCSDNMNLSKKSRRQFIAAAKQAGRVVIVVTFISTSVDELQERCITRGDRGNISPERAKAMFHSMRVPAFDEADMLAAV